MNRFGAFLEQFWAELKWTGDAPDRTKKIVTQVLFLLPLVGIPVSANALGNWFAIISPYLAYPIILYLGWVAGTAWQKSSGPIIWTSKQASWDDSWSFFEIRVENRGPGKVRAEAYAVDLTKENGERIPVIDSQLPLHWRGFEADEPVMLYGHTPGHAVLFAVQRVDGIAKSFFVFASRTDDGKPGLRFEPMLPGIPLDQQRKVCLSVKVDFHDENGTFLCSKLRRFWIIRDPMSRPLYRVKPV